MPYLRYLKRDIRIHKDIPFVSIFLQMGYFCVLMNKRKSRWLRLIRGVNCVTIKAIECYWYLYILQGESMVREKNVKLMTKIAIYEKNQGKSEIPMNEYYKGDYVRLNVLKSVVFGTIAYGLIVALVVVYQMEFLLSNILKMDYKALAIKILVLYLLWTFVYWLVARIVYARRYERSRSRIIIYNHDLKKLQEEVKKEVPKAKKGVVIGDDFIDF